MNPSSALPSASSLTLTREELYARVWSQPMLRLAAEFGVSDVAIARLCQRRNIPRPAPGYWAKLAAGHAVERPVLPPAQTGQERPVSFRRAAPPAVPAAAHAAVHPIAERVHRCLSRYKARAYGLVLVNEPGLPRVLASPAQAPRITAFLHTLLEGAAAQNTPWGAAAARPPAFERDARRATLRVEETLCPSVAGERPSRRPGGLFTITLRGPAGARRDVTRWEESAALPLDRIATLALEALRTKLAPPAIAPALHFPRPARIEPPRPAGLLREAQHWAESSLLERYVDACEARWTRDENGLTPGRRRWLARARSAVQSLSPFARHPADDALRPGVVVPPPELFAGTSASRRSHSG